MEYKNHELSKIIKAIDLGSSVAELDTLLQSSRVDTSVFADLLSDKIDLIPGTKGSGKSALYRIFVEFLVDHLLESRKVVIAHGVQQHGDQIFNAFKNEFEELTEDDFVNFWCIYIISLVNEQFLTNPLYKKYIQNYHADIAEFKKICSECYIPEIKKEKSLYEIIGWALTALKKMTPRLTYKPLEGVGEFGLDLFGNPTEPITSGIDSNLPVYSEKIRQKLEALLKKADLSIWLMIDRLDEIFPRRSELERKALRGLLKTTRIFQTDRIRLKIFLRDDILKQVVNGEEGFTALTHVTARKADTLRWSEDQILSMIVKRLFSCELLCDYLDIDKDKLNASREYRNEAFYKVFPKQVHHGPNQSNTYKMDL